MVHRWNSQPKVRHAFIGNFLLSCAMMTSGNNYGKVALLFKFISLGFPGPTAYHRTIRLFTAPVINTTFSQMMQELRDRHKGKDLIVAGEE